MITALKTATNKTKGILIDSEDVKINYTIDYGYIFIILQFIERLRIRETLSRAKNQSYPTNDSREVNNTRQFVYL